MKKLTFTLCAAAMLLAKASNAQITDPSPYCPGGFDDDNGNFTVPHSIQEVKISSLDNTSSSTAAPGKHYTYYNNIAAPELAVGYGYDLSVTFDYPSTVHYINAYIDFNHDNDFDDQGEMVLEQTVHGTRTNPAEALVNVPGDAVLGTTRMRVMIFEDDKYMMSGGLHGFACSNDTLDWGETEDYDLNLVIGATSVKGIAAAKTISVYPNPASSTVTVGIDLSNAQVQVTDMRGVVAKVSRNGNQLDVSSLATGMYVLRITKDNQTYTQQLHIER
ncbi:MAG: T9SS type A sorting domain-containing protein [Sphingobacteriales bacterium]|nr:MAG: T9SS type A sorting domain-containing protein [Sphingobacteriales bacterium]